MEKKGGNYRFVIAFLICLSAISSCYCQYQLAPMGNQLIDTFHLTSVQFAAVCTAPMVPAIFVSFLVGLVVDRLGARRVIILGLTLAVIGLTLRNFVGSYLSLYLCMLLPGFAASFLNATHPKIFGEWFSAGQVGLMIGLFQAANAFGQTLAIGTTAMLPDFRIAFVFSTILSVITLVLWILFMKESGQNKEQEQEKLSMKQCLKSVLTSRGVYVAGISILCVYGTYTVITTYMTIALESRGIEAVAAGATTSVVSMAKLLGCISIPAAVRKIKNMKLVIIVLAMISAVITVFAWRLPAGIGLTVALFVLGVCIGGLVPILISVPIRLPEIGAKYAGTAGGVVATLQLMGAVVIPTYVCAPIAGDNYTLMFGLAGLIMACVCVLGLLFPKLQNSK